MNSTAGSTRKIAQSAPVRHMLAQVTDITAGTHGPDMARIGHALTHLAADYEVFAPLMGEMPRNETAATWLHLPDRGPRLALVHRPAGHMSAIHSHRVWVALAPIMGTESHELWQRAGHQAQLTSYQEIRPGQYVTVTPPGDTHSHGHIAGTGDAPYTLVLLGDNMLRYTRDEYVSPDGPWHHLQAGDGGATDRPLTVNGV